MIICEFYVGCSLFTCGCVVWLYKDPQQNQCDDVKHYVDAHEERSNLDWNDTSFSDLVHSCQSKLDPVGR